MAVDLVERLQSAAAAVIASERPTIEHDSGSLRSVIVELSLTGRGDVSDAEVYTMRRLSVNRALGLGSRQLRP